MKYTFYLLLAALFIIACNKEELNNSPLTSDMTIQALVLGDDKNEDGKDEKGKEDCFKIVFPVNITMPDNSVLSGDEKDLWDTVKVWYEANPDSKEKPSLNYPVDIIFADETLQSVANGSEMEIVKKDCE